MILNLMRLFSYKPAFELNFINEKVSIVANTRIRRYDLHASTILLGIPSYLSYHLITNYSLMGWGSFLLTGLGLSICSPILFTWLKLRPRLIVNLYLLKCGQIIEIQTLSLRKKISTIEISDILNPETNEHVMQRMEFYSTYLIETKKGKTFYLIPQSNTIYPDILKEIIKGNTIDTRQAKKIEPTKNIIDI